MRIDPLPVPGRGILGLAACPGRGHGDIAADLAMARRWGAVALLSLIEDAEWARLGLPAGVAVIEASGLAWLRLPVPDMQPPCPATLAAWPGIAAAIQAAWQDDGRVLVHCAAGLGRTGTVAAGILVGAGMPPAEAIARVRATRPGSIETAAQHAWVESGPGLPIP